MRQQGGFVMADAIIALVLISILLAALLGMNRNGLEVSSQAKSRLTAAMVAQSLLEERDQNSADGHIEIDNTQFHWTRKVRDVTDSNRPLIGLDEINITVSWSAGTAGRKVEFSTARVRGVL